MHARDLDVPVGLAIAAQVPAKLERIRSAFVKIRAQRSETRSTKNVSADSEASAARVIGDVRGLAAVVLSGYRARTAEKARAAGTA
ncbi:MAG: hypothetical protein CK428_25875 [Mycobacterium sp.]|nr:MAG: hypothetical protein CK428_25875 [Mycobacterium sp.]